MHVLHRPHLLHAVAITAACAALAIVLTLLLAGTLNDLTSTSASGSPTPNAEPRPLDLDRCGMESEPVHEPLRSPAASHGRQAPSQTRRCRRRSLVMTGGGQVDPYAELDVSRDASSEEIRRAYRQVARRHHPDVNQDPGGAERFAAAARAYEILSDPVARARYDNRLHRPVPIRRSSRPRPAVGRRAVLELTDRGPLTSRTSLSHSPTPTVAAS